MGEGLILRVKRRGDQYWWRPLIDGITSVIYEKVRTNRREALAVLTCRLVTHNYLGVLYHLTTFSEIIIYV